jgi:hypothetical protein
MAENWRGKIGAMTPGRRDFYLEGAALARLSAINEQGFPHVVPAWYHWDGSSFWFVLRERAEIAAILAERPHVGLVIDEGSVKDEAAGRMFEMPKVWAQGLAEVVERPNIGGQWVEIAKLMALRYLGPHGPEYIVASINQPRWLFKVEPTVLKTWEGTGWAKKYWVENDKGLSYDEAHGLSRSVD